MESRLWRVGGPASLHVTTGLLALMSCTMLDKARRGSLGRRGTYKRAPVRVKRLARDGKVFDVAGAGGGAGVAASVAGRAREVPPRPGRFLLDRRRREVHAAVVDDWT